jgi:hypothetical protein
MRWGGLREQMETICSGRTTPMAPGQIPGDSEFVRIANGMT